jgi:hypothetical protein
MIIKFRYILLILLVLALSPSLVAQRFKGAVMGGMNISQVDGDEVYGYKRVGGHFGVAAILPMKKWDITLETVFNQKGAYQKPQYEYWVMDSTSQTVDSALYTGEYNLRLNYVEVPIMVHYTDRERYTAGLGFSYGRLVSVSEVEHGGSIPPYSDTIAFNKNDFSVLVDLQIRIWKQLKFNVRFSYSMVPIRERTYHDILYEYNDPWTRKQYNNTLTFRLVYVFNEQEKQVLPINQ